MRLVLGTLARWVGLAWSFPLCILAMPGLMLADFGDDIAGGG